MQKSKGCAPGTLCTGPYRERGRANHRCARLSCFSAWQRKVAKKQSDYLVFISHSSKDRWIARQMAAIIERQAKRYGVRTFLDEV